MRNLCIEMISKSMTSVMVCIFPNGDILLFYNEDQILKGVDLFSDKVNAGIYKIVQCLQYNNEF